MVLGLPWYAETRVCAFRFPGRLSPPLFQWLQRVDVDAVFLLSGAGGGQGRGHQ